MYRKRGNVKITKIVSDLRDAIVDLKKVVLFEYEMPLLSLSTEDDRSFCRNMFCKFKSVVVFFKILTCLLSSSFFNKEKSQLTSLPLDNHVRCGRSYYYHQEANDCCIYQIFVDFFCWRFSGSLC